MAGERGRMPKWGRHSTEAWENISKINLGPVAGGRDEDNEDRGFAREACRLHGCPPVLHTIVYSDRNSSSLYA